MEGPWASHAFGGVAGQLRIVAGSGSWTIEGDLDGDGAADLAIAVTTATSAPLAASDFML